ncbi:family 20 glycosylhydrolase [Clostridium swellfunianum]|uniref:beta-N-acetylhexosaminidase n=1 Tax=Clostridium swellfunianum TaxID=1367462 RepID=UPI00202FBD1B|nr:glycoside hydrolase family 20 zincin-like fold domain-containing protein [Clostridium swellfunianum]MCM0647572.1 family 20 glycosylhydrolase [Clostridium swellfunianum]
MYLLPVPKTIINKEESFFIDNYCEIVLNARCSSNDFEAAVLLKEEIKKSTGIVLNINKAFMEKHEGCILIKKQTGESESYEINIDEHGIEVIGADDAGLFYGIQTLRQIIRQSGIKVPAITIKDSPYFKNRGFYHDVTRGKVPTLETLKELVDRLAFYKINHLQLYIEHSFAFKNLSEVWVDKDPLTAEEILELDQYCIKRHVELIPSLSTFGHLYEVLTAKSFAHLSELQVDTDSSHSWIDRMNHHTLNVSNEESLKLVQSMLEEFVPLFTSKKFNICCDETFDLGKGKNAELAKKVGEGRLYTDFLTKVISSVKRYDKEVMFWGDIILKHPELLSEIPKDVTCLNWGYHASVTEDNTRTIAESGVPQYVCPAVTGWNRLMNEMDNASVNIRKMVEYGRNYNAVGVLNTDWGDYGHVNLFGNSMPGMIFGASLSWNPDGEKDIEKADKAISVLEFGERAENLMNTLRELSRQQPFHWSYLTFWKEKDIVDKDFINPWLEVVRNIDHNKASEAYYKALEIEKELLRLAAIIPEHRKLDMKEFIVSARGIALTQAAFLPIKKYSFGFEKVEPVLEPAKLASLIEYWLADYCSVWRERNKESELIRIKESFIYISNFLRTIE